MQTNLITRSDRRRVDRNKRVSRDPIELRERHHEILNMHLLGIPGVKIAKELGISEKTVSYTIESTLGREKLAIMRGAKDAKTVSIYERMQEIIPKALDIYDKILSPETNEGISISLQKSTASDILKDFSGLAVPKKVVSISARLTPELIEEIKSRGKEAARECGLIQTIEEETGLFAGEVIK
jgi:DNA-binding CsgD family transcriptional regulator